MTLFGSRSSYFKSADKWRAINPGDFNKPVQPGNNPFKPVQQGSNRVKKATLSSIQQNVPRKSIFKRIGLNQHLSSNSTGRQFKRQRSTGKSGHLS